MTTLTTAYQYIGRTNPVKAYKSNFNYYVLLYAKTEPNADTGRHKVTVKMRMACDANSSFYGFISTGSAQVDGQTAINWSREGVPGSAWGESPSITEDGVTYRRWVDMKEGTVEVNADYAAKEIEISTSWSRQSMAETPPDWLPSITEAKATVTVQLPAIEKPQPEPEPEPEPDAPEDNLPDDDGDGAPPEDAPGDGTAPGGAAVYADGVLAYDSRLENYDLDGLRITRGVNVGGTAEIVMPDTHPAYNYFVSQRTIVTIYRAGKLRFRGRALYPADTFYGQRTITCEGELCLLRDSMNRPYLYQSTPAKIFRALVRKHNEQVEPFKQFTIGTVTVTDPNNYIRMESENAETILATMTKLLERCGGYITFTTCADGTRAIHWLADIGQRSTQSIEFGENLLDFTRTGANTTALATGLVPYGAKDPETKKRITIESVNGGKDYIIAEDAKAIRGTIMATATWDDVTKPANLLKKAQAYLKELKSFITSLELTALDLSYLDKDIDSFTAGDFVRVISIPHGLNEDFQITQLTEDLLHPEQSRVLMGKDIPSLTGADVLSDYNSRKALETATAGLKTDYTVDVQQVATQAGEQVLGQVAQVYAPQATVDEQLAALLASLDAEITAREEADTTLQEGINTEANARAGVINKVNGVVHISGGAPINILGGKIDINGSEINVGIAINFKNESGIRIADKSGNVYYVLRVDGSNNCFVGNDYTNLYLRAKDAVYLHKTGAAVTSDRRHKNSIEALPEAYMAMLDKLEPVRFRYNDHGDRYHVGFVAQDVEQALTESGLSPDDFGGLVDVTGDGTNLGLAYDEFIGLLLHKIRKLEERLEALEE